MREVYLDNAATTKVRPEIAEAMAKAMVENYGNPSSIYKAAQRAGNSYCRCPSAGCGSDRRVT